MSLFATALPANGAAADETAKVDGVYAQAISVAFTAYKEKLPEASIDQYTVTAARENGEFHVVFAPKRAEGEAPTLGGRTSLGRELNVWVSADGASVTRTAFAR